MCIHRLSCWSIASCGHHCQPKTKKLFEEAALESAKMERAANRDMNRKQVEELKKVGMTITELSPEQLKAFQDAVAPIYAEFEGKIGKDLISEFKQAAQNAK